MIAELYGKYKEEWKLLPYISASYSSGLDTSQELRIIMPVGSDVPTMAKIGNFLAVTIDNVEYNSNSITVAGHAINANSLENEQYSDLIGNSIAEVCSLLADKAGISIIGADSTPIESAGLLDSTAIATVSTIAQILKASSIYIDSTLEKDRIRIGTPWVGGRQAYVMEWSEVINKKTYDACLCTKTAPIAERVQMVLAKKEPTAKEFNEENPPTLLISDSEQPGDWETIKLNEVVSSNHPDYWSNKGQLAYYGKHSATTVNALNSSSRIYLQYSWKVPYPTESNPNEKITKSVTFSGTGIYIQSTGYAYGAPLLDEFQSNPIEKYILPESLFVTDITYSTDSNTPPNSSILANLIKEKGTKVPTKTEDKAKYFEKIEEVCLSNEHKYFLQFIPVRTEIFISNLFTSTSNIEPGEFDDLPSIMAEAYKLAINFEDKTFNLPPESNKINVGNACPYWHLLAKLEGVNTAFINSQNDFEINKNYTVEINDDFNPNAIYYDDDDRLKYNGPYKDQSGKKRFRGTENTTNRVCTWQNLPEFKGGYTYDELTLLNATFGSSIIAQGMFGSQIIDLSSSNTTTSLTPAQGSTPKIVKAITPQAETYEWGSTGVNTLAISSPLWKHREQTTAQELLDFANLKNGTRTLKYKCYIPEGWEWEDLFKVEINGLRPVEMVVYFELNTVEYTLKAKE